MQLAASKGGRFTVTDNPRNNMVKLLDNSNGVALILESVEHAKEIVGAMPSAIGTEWEKTLAQSD